MSHYLRVILNVAFIIASFGLVLPWLISQADDFLVLSGFVYMFLIFPAVLFYFNRSYVTSTINKLKGE